MQEELISIQKAADYLGVSTKTLRRWEQRGILVPQRTSGNQRRYTLLELENFKNGQEERKHEERKEEASDIINSLQPLDTISYIKLEMSKFPLSKKLLLTLAPVIILFLASGVVVKDLVFKGIGTGGEKSVVAQKQGNGNAVLGAETESNNYIFKVNVSSTFGESASFLKGITVNGQTIFAGGIDTNNRDVNAGSGKLTASNVIYSLQAGSGLSVTNGQTPTIANTGVLSLGGSTGAIDLGAGTGISIDGLKITNTDTGSSQYIFKNIVSGGQKITADSNSDTLNFTAGTGVTLSTDALTKTITIASNQGQQTGVTSLQGQTGALTLAAGTGLSLAGLTFSNSGVTSVNTLTGDLNIAAGSNVSVTKDANTNTVTISSTISNNTISNVSGWTQSGNYVTLANSGNYVGIGTATPASALQVGGDILPTQNGVSNLGSSNLSWNNIYANQIVGTGAQLNLTIPATSSATGLSVSMSGTGSGQLASFSFNGTQVLGVGTNDVYIGGKVSMITDDTNLLNAKDVFVYDTSKDSDAGQWVNGDTSQSSSWYNEQLDHTGLACQIGTDKRCGQRPFPQKVTIYVTSNSVYIYDNKDNTMWMKFSEGQNFAINGTSVNLTSVYALNGIIFLGTDTNGLIEINFLTDKIFEFNYNQGNGGRSQFLGTISERNSAKSYGSIESWGRIASDKVNGVFARVINGKVYVAVSTLGGASVINLSDQKVVKYVDN